MALDDLTTKQKRKMIKYLKSAYVQYKTRPDSPCGTDQQTSFLEYEHTGLTILCGGTGSGKTSVGSYKVVKFLLSTPPPYDLAPFLVSSVTSQMSGDIYNKNMATLLDGKIESISWRNVKLGHPKSVILKPSANGFRHVIHFYSYEQGRDAFQSINATGLWFDEMAPQSILEEALARTRSYNYKCKIYTLTPLRPDSWLQEIVENPDDNPMYRIFRLNSYLNHYINQEFMGKFLESLTPEQRKTRAYGDFTSFKGKIYNEFSKALHVTDKEPRNVLQWYISIDWGYHHSAFTLTARDDKDQYWFVDNHQYKEATLPAQVVLDVQKMAEKWNCGRVTHIYDSADAASAALLRLEGLHNVRPARKNVVDGLMVCKNLFWQNKILINKRCKDLIDQLDKYRFRDAPSVSNKDVYDDDIKIHKFEDHLCDCLRYCLYSIHTGGANDAELLMEDYRKQPETKPNKTFFESTNKTPFF